jgi:hypothetical protein
VPPKSKQHALRAALGAFNPLRTNRRRLTRTDRRGSAPPMAWIFVKPGSGARRAAWTQTTRSMFRVLFWAPSSTWNFAGPGSGARCRADPCKPGLFEEAHCATGIQQHVSRAFLGDNPMRTNRQRLRELIAVAPRSPDGPDFCVGWIRLTTGQTPAKPGSLRRIAVAPRTPMIRIFVSAGSGHAIWQTPAKGLIEADRRVPPDGPDLCVGWIMCSPQGRPLQNRALRGGSPCCRDTRSTCLIGRIPCVRTA